jgi:hypothetical protein
MKYIFIILILLLLFLSGCYYTTIYSTGEINNCFNDDSVDDCVGCCLDIEQNALTHLGQTEECQYICYKAVYNNKQNKEFIIATK